MEAELRRKVGDEGLILFLLGQMLREPRAFPVQVRFQFVVHFLHPLAVGLVFPGRLQPGLLDQPEHFYRAVTALLPKNMIEFLE